MALTEEALDGLRDGERLLDELPPLDPDHETVRLAMIQLLEVYASLTDRSDATRALMEANAATIEAARMVLREVRANLQQRGPGSTVN